MVKAETVSQYKKALHFYCIVWSGFTFILLCMGGTVTSTNSGLSVPDWPTTYHQNMFTFPMSKWVGGVFYEHTHRLMASLVGCLTIGFCLLVWKWETRKWMKRLAPLALGMVILQGVLGGVTVLFKLPVEISASHACLAELFFCLTVLACFGNSRIWFSAPIAIPFREAIKNNLLKLAAIFWSIVFIQITTGAIIRHSFAGLAIPTFPKAYGEWIPPFWNFVIAIHFLHSRIGALSILVCGVILVLWTLKMNNKLAKQFALILLLLLLAQMLFGMLTIWSGKAALPTTVHMATGALIFADSFLLFLSISRFGAKRNNLVE